MTKDVTSKSNLPQQRETGGDSWVLAVLEDLRNYAEHRRLEAVSRHLQTAISGVAVHVCDETARRYRLQAGDW